MATISPRDDDKGFAKFLQQIQSINVNLKESTNKDESKLDQLNNIKKSATGISKDTDFKPVVISLDKIDSVLEKSLKEQVSLRKIILKNGTIGFAAQEAIVPAAIKERKVSPAPTIQQSKKTVEKVVPKRLGQDYLKTGKEDKEEKEPLRFGRSSDFLEGTKERIGSIKSFFSGPVAEAYASSAKGTQVQKGNQRPSKESSIKAGEDLFEKIVKKEGEIKTLEEKIAKQTTAGFQPLKKDLKQIESLQKDLTGIHTEAGMIPEKSKVKISPSPVSKEASVGKAASKGIINDTSVNPVVTGASVATKTDISVSKEQLQVTKDSLFQLKAIREALSSANNSEPNESLDKSFDIPDLPGKDKTPPGKPTGKGSAGRAAKNFGRRALGGLGKAARFLSPLAAPVALGLGAYEASEYLGETNYGDRMAAGGKSDAGQTAQQAFKQNVTPTIDPNKAGVTPDQAAAALENGSPRDIEKLGGKEALQIIAARNDQSDAETARLSRRNAEIAPAITSTSGQVITIASTENADMTRDVANQAPSSTSVVSTNVSNNNTTSYVPMKSVPRDEQGSNLDRYLNRIAVY